MLLYCDLGLGGSSALEATSQSWVDFWNKEKELAKDGEKDVLNFLQVY